MTDQERDELDTEGQGFRIKQSEGDEPGAEGDTEAHGRRWNKPDDEPDEVQDSEGHARLSDRNRKVNVKPVEW